MKKLINKKPVRFYLWITIGYFLLGAFGIAGYFPGKFHLVLLNNFWAVVYVAVFNFMLFEYVVPFILQRNKSIIPNILYGIAALGLYLLLYTYGSYAWRLLGNKLYIYSFLQTYPTLQGHLGFQLIYCSISVFFFGVGRHIYGHVKLRQASQQLLIEKQAAELNYLRSQTNPHFLFNTLNNIYSLASDKSDLAPESIFRLSEILRFMLYETSARGIPVQQEISVINDYIALEKLRYDESLDVIFKYDIEDMTQLLPPLLLMPLVENAFKHGTAETIDTPFVNIHLSINDRQLSLVVKNSADKPLAEESGKERIGLSNLRRQLQLLYSDHQLLVHQCEADFTASLKINLQSHA
jgi:hypothetical protein